MITERFGSWLCDMAGLPWYGKAGKWLLGYGLWLSVIPLSPLILLCFAIQELREERREKRSLPTGQGRIVVP